MVLKICENGCRYEIVMHDDSVTKFCNECGGKMQFVTEMNGIKLKT